VSVDDVERPIVERKGLSIGLLQIHLDLRVTRVLPRELEGGLGEIDAGDQGAASREANEVGANPAADLEEGFSPIAFEIDEAGEVPELVEPILVEIGEELPGSRSVAGHLEVVDALVPVGLDSFQEGVQGAYYSIFVKRDIGALASREFDLVIVGGGVYGAAIAWDASLRGLSVALVERNDFGSGTSFNNLKTIHGGVRYLQHGDLKRMRESVRERRTLMRVAPHLVHPLPFLVPTYQGSLARSRSALRLALFLNELVSWDRNRDARADKHLPPGRALSRAECLELAPELDASGLTGGALWYDAQMYNSDRLTLSFVLSAAREGAVVANFVEAIGFVRSGNRVQGVVAKDTLTGAGSFEIRGKMVVNASGPSVDRLLESVGGEKRKPLFHSSKALNLVTRPLVENVALGLTRGGPLLVVAPWRHVSLVGTLHLPYEGEADALETNEEDVQRLLDGVNRAYPRAELVRADVRLVHRGLLPAVPNGRELTLVKSYTIEDTFEGLLSVVGVKYTTARDVAEKTVDRALARLGRPAVGSRSATTPVAGGDFESFADLLRVVGKPHLAYNYGTLSREVLAIPDACPLGDATPVTAAEVRYAAREEMALDLASVVLRRTELGSAGHPGRGTLERAAAILGEELSWTEDRKRAELEAVEGFYRARS
jgi:glycerol-3-phosphate dehydrogenase